MAQIFSVMGFKKISINAQDMQLCQSQWISYIFILDPPSFPLIGPPAPSPPSQLCVRIQGSPVDRRHLPLPHPGITTIAAQYLPPTVLGSVLGRPVLTVALQSIYSWCSNRLKEKKRFRNFAEGYTTSPRYRQDMNSDLPCSETCFCCSTTLRGTSTPLSPQQYSGQRLKLSQPQ